MNIFSWLYDKMIQWSGHPHARCYLAGVSFAESSFFPLPPDIMLISMGLAKPIQSVSLAVLTTIFSVLGGIFGYAIGYYAIAYLMPWLMESSYYPAYQHAVIWFKSYGVLAIFIAGFSPIPYKVFTVSAGALHMALLPFILASLVGRGLRFLLLGYLLYYFGEALNLHLRKYIDYIGWGLALLIAIILLAHYLIG